MRIPRCFLILAIASGFLAADQKPHEFTNTEGRTLKAQIVKSDASRVWLRLSGGRVAPVALDSLIEADRLYISKWTADRLPDLEIKPDFNRGRSNDTKGEVVSQNFEMSVTMKNFSPSKDLEESEVIYYLIGRDVNDSDRYTVMSKQVKEISVAHGTTSKVTFKNIRNRYRDGDFKNRGVRGLGYVLQIRRKRDMRRIYLASATTILDSAKEEIVMLEEGDVVGKTFIKEVKKVVKKEVPKEEKKEEVITIR
jgi:hypothetical protein